MVRGDGGRLYDIFREQGVAGTGWCQLAPQVKCGVERKPLNASFRAAYSQGHPGTVVAGASQIWRFAKEFQFLDWVGTLSTAHRPNCICMVVGAPVR